MAQVELSINGRPYVLACADGEEPRLRQLGDYLDTRIHKLSKAVGNVGEVRLLLLLALTLADELSEANNKVGALSRELRTHSDAGLTEVASQIERIAKRIETIANKVAA
jgi:cell division protein ZapA